MSRIGNQLILLPVGVSLEVSDKSVIVKGSKGELVVPIPTGISIATQENTVTVSRTNDTAKNKAFHGLTRSLLANAIIGVNEGFEKKLELHGVGYRATVDCQSLSMNLGFSHPVKITPPEGISFKVEKNVITVSGIDKQLIGQVSANIRSYRKPEPYKGKGVRYSDEMVRRKPGKAAKSASA